MITYIIRGTALTLTAALSAILGVFCVEMAGAVPANPAFPLLECVPVIGAFGCLMVCLWAGWKLRRLTGN